MHLTRPAPRLTILLALMAAPSVAADKMGPEPYQPAVATLVASMLTSEHFAQHPLDDEMSSRWFDGYLAALDYTHMFFLASDVERFEPYRLALDDATRRPTPNLEPAFEIHDLYRIRVQERLEAAIAMLDQPVDLTVDETFDLDRSDDPWPTTAAEADDLWRRRIKEQVLRGVLRGETEKSQRELLAKRFRRIERDIVSSAPPDVLEIYLGALAQAYDPHSDYLKPTSNEDFDIHMSNSLEGIGATLRTEAEYTEVVSLVAGGPAQLGGDLQPGDKIIAVAQGAEEPVDVVDTRIDRVVKLIRGPKGTEVRLTVIPAKATDPSDTRVISIVRDEVLLTANDAKSRVIEVPTADGPIKVGIIDLPSFYLDFDARRAGDPAYKSTTRDVRRLLTNLKQQEVQGIILDLRQNGGGSLSEAVELTGLFIPKGPVVQIGDRRGRTETIYDPDPGLAWDGPLMVLTSPLSASASEILAGAVQDYGRGLVVGSKSTHGKGTVQDLKDLDSQLRYIFRYQGNEAVAGALKVTTHKFYRVTGASTQLEGVHADVVLPSPYDGLDLLESDLQYALSWDKVTPLQFSPWSNLTHAASTLQVLSEARVAQDPAFTELEEVIKEREQTDSVVSLNLETRRKELEAVIEPDLPGVDDAEDADPDAPDIVLDEATRIMRDWLTGGVTTASAG